MKTAAHVQQLASDQPVMSYIAQVRKNGDQQKLSDHLLGVALLASGNAAKLDLAMVGELLGILHDLGKYSTEFQIYREAFASRSTRDGEIPFIR